MGVTGDNGVADFNGHKVTDATIRYTNKIILSTEKGVFTVTPDEIDKALNTTEMHDIMTSTDMSEEDKTERFVKTVRRYINEVLGTKELCCSPYEIRKEYAKFAKQQENQKMIYFDLSGFGIEDKIALKYTDFKLIKRTVQFACNAFLINLIHRLLSDYTTYFLSVLTIFYMVLTVGCIVKMWYNGYVELFDSIKKNK